jgi:hypothetical protein
MRPGPARSSISTSSIPKSKLGILSMHINYVLQEPGMGVFCELVWSFRRASEVVAFVNMYSNIEELQLQLMRICSISLKTMESHFLSQRFPKLHQALMLPSTRLRYCACFTNPILSTIHTHPWKTLKSNGTLLPRPARYFFCPPWKSLGLGNIDSS